MENKTEESKTEKLTLGGLQLCSVPLQSLTQVKLPVKNSYWLNKTIDRIGRELDDYEKLRVDLIKKYGEEVEGNEGNFQVKKENVQDFNKEFIELLNIEIEDFKFTPISLETLEKSTVELTSIEIGNLCKFGFVKE